VSANAIEWLMEGDPVIRWQVMRDLLDMPEPEWQNEREKVTGCGWGRQFLDLQKPDGTWPEGRWTGTTWTLLTVMDCGLPAGDPKMKLGVEAVVSRLMPPAQPVEPKVLMERMDLCHVGFWLRFGSYFMPDDERWPAVADTLLRAQLEDGGWNCRLRNYPNTTHSSFHTTFNVLEGLKQAARSGIVDSARFESSEARAMEFMLEHKMYRSDKTGQVISDRFTALSFPSQWHYTVLRGLDYMRGTPAIKDERLSDPLALLASRRKPNGRWPVEKRIPGLTLFDMEKQGGDSRWNTLRAFRVLKAAGADG
jgi:hypothetical protein